MEGDAATTSVVRERLGLDVETAVVVETALNVHELTGLGVEAAAELLTDQIETALGVLDHVETALSIETTLEVEAAVVVETALDVHPLLGLLVKATLGVSVVGVAAGAEASAGGNVDR